MNQAETPDDGDAIPDFADRVIREALDDSDNLRAILRHLLHEAADGFDFARMRALPRDFAMPNWKGRERDFLCEIPYRIGESERDALVCVLIEHQTRPDARMPLRMLIYASFYWERHLRAWESAPTPRKPLRVPTIIPIVLHASPRRWTGPRTLVEMLDEPTAFHPFAPRWEPIFWEVGNRTAQEWLTSDDPFLQLLAIVRAEDAEREEALAVYRTLLQHLADLRETNAMRWTHLLRFALGWVVYRRPPTERADWLQVTEDSQATVLAKEEIRHMGKTIAQSWVEEGIGIGEARGIGIGEARGIGIGEARGIEIGEARGRATLRDLVAEIGAERLGAPSSDLLAELRSITDVSRLRLLVQKAMKISKWEDLLQE